MDNPQNIGTVNGFVGNGLFGATLTWILEILPFLKKHEIYPNWDIHTKCYGLIFPEIIKPKKITTTSNVAISLQVLIQTHSYKYSHNECVMAHDIFFEYFDISEDILQAVEIIKKEFCAKTLCIHFRGTDKLCREASYISKEDVVKNITSFLSTNEFDTIFIITDDETFITDIKNTSFFSEKKLVFTNSLRSNDNYPLHLKTDNNIDRAKEAMIDSLALSNCNYVIKTSSCLSDWVKIWTPAIEVYNLNRFYHEWFPQKIIPVKSYL